MLGFLKELFSTKKVVDTGAELAKDMSNGIDAIFLTKEEKEQYRQKVGDWWLKAMERLHNENSARSITRRILSVLILTQYCIFLYAAVIFYPIDVTWSAMIFKIVEHELPIVITVIGFYFGPYFLTYLFGGKKGEK